MEANRFWSKVTKTDDGCWEWVGARTTAGYGAVNVDGRMRRAHRVAYELVIGAVPSGMNLLHSCDNRTCVNPAHLRFGTQRENMADMDSRGRRFTPFAGQIQKGSRNRNARLDEAKVSQVKARLAAGEHHATIAADYGVHRATISQIARGHSWAHVHADPSIARVSPLVTIDAG